MVEFKRVVSRFIKETKRGDKLFKTYKQARDKSTNSRLQIKTMQCADRFVEKNRKVTNSHFNQLPDVVDRDIGLYCYSILSLF